MPTKNNVTPISRKSTKTTKSNKPHVEPTWVDDIRAVDQASIQPDITPEARLNCLYTLADYADKLPEGAELPEPPEGYERCAECGLPTRVGGNGLCPLHDIKTVTVDEPATSEAPTEQPSETAAEPTPREERVFSPVQIRKLARERVWFVARKHHLPMVKPGAKDAEGYILSTDEAGGTCGRVLITYHAASIEDAAERRKFAITQLEKAAHLLMAASLPVERANIEGIPYVTVPTTRVPGKADESVKRSKKSATQWTVQLSGDEEQGSGI